MNPKRDLARLAGRLDQTAAVLGWPEDRLYLRVEEVSRWSPAQQVDHVLQSLDLMLGRAAALVSGTDPEIQADGRPSIAGRLVLTTGWIPRGKAEAPETVLPDPRPVRHRLREAHHAACETVRDLASDASRVKAASGTLAHPLLGAFSARAWVRFADVHTRHHLRIVADIDRRRAIGAPVPEAEAAAGEDPGLGVSVESP
jgi:hypothetical protein